MLIHQLKLSGFLSFGPKGVDLRMEPLNVLIGPNGSGKSNFLEAVALLKSAPRDISEPFRRDGIREWLWKGQGASNTIKIETLVDYPHAGGLRHLLKLTNHGGHPIVTDEQIEPSEKRSNEKESLSYYRPPQNEQTALLMAQSRSKTQGGSENLRIGDPTPLGLTGHSIEFSDDFQPEESLLSCAANTEYPALWHLQEQFKRIRLYREWSFGPSTALRQNQSAHDRTDFLDEGGGNLALVLSHFQGENKRKLVAALQELFDGIVDVTCPVTSGSVSLFLEEGTGKLIPASRLSDGTLRYLCLLAILLHPEPPPFIAIEEPELGLHPDVVAKVADLLVAASQRTQLVVTTHSRMLVDALSDHPSSVVVCEKENGESRFTRLDSTRLKAWLDKYSLGELWRSGELGGNRW
ncbi:MAG: AAA family ATPase [Nitrospira sp. SB0677_bin_15]|nr:AAA family ATPase [Nitrospira sp. SB0667_bin_9]MYD30648.1 AAA family ATPase [Nitrospira sp. SB0661_bin_20]MYG41367.1 AAA family ATPase [Nitrospira sp. SB0677_bin_15]MYH01314.1 AAA family ATPase [Nitrospira sp. SB0675_bin_23]MYJ23069.1 AAA family ATPase [Nitrospira sp. SB0673_bin_12]